MAVIGIERSGTAALFALRHARVWRVAAGVVALAPPSAVDADRAGPYHRTAGARRVDRAQRERGAGAPGSRFLVRAEQDRDVRPREATDRGADLRSRPPRTRILIIARACAARAWSDLRATSVWGSGA